MFRLLSLLAALLVLSACDSGGIDITPGSAIRVDPASGVFTGDDLVIEASFTNTTGRDIWLGRPEVQLFFQPETPADFSPTPAPILAYSPVITLELRPNVRIRPGETHAVLLALDPNREVTPLADGDYRIGLTLYTDSGDQDSLYRGELAPDAVRFSDAFPLTFR